MDRSVKNNNTKKKKKKKKTGCFLLVFPTLFRSTTNNFFFQNKPIRIIQELKPYKEYHMVDYVELTDVSPTIVETDVENCLLENCSSIPKQSETVDDQLFVCLGGGILDHLLYKNINENNM